MTSREQRRSAAHELDSLMRSGDDVMRLARLGAMHPTRLSFTRTLVRRMHRERWSIEPSLWQMDDAGFGRAVYRVRTARETLSFAAFTQPLEPSERTDRVIATRWDAAFALVAGEPDSDRLNQLAANVPRQEAGRVTSDALVLSRANKSVRAFEYVSDALARGRQPNAATLDDTGYLMRTTAVYGNGKFGLADLDELRRGGVFALPYQAEMLTVYLARELSFDLVEHVACRRAPDRAVALHRSLKRALGVGNATGLGMAPFLVRHPQLVHRWISAKERALACVKALPTASASQCERFVVLLARAIRHVDGWQTDDRRQQRRIDVLARELGTLAAQADESAHSMLGGDRPYLRLTERVARDCSLETQELVNALLLEMHPDEVNAFEQETGIAEALTVQPRMRIGELRALIEAHYRWALAVDFDAADATSWFWYMSQEKSEPRLGERGVDDGDAREMRIDIARQVQALYAALDASEVSDRERVAEFLLRVPGWRGVVARVQSLAHLAYAEVRGNLLDRDSLAIDLLRAKLATFGAGRFDPKSDRWTRITLFQGAPPRDELGADDADDWWMPVSPQVNE